MLVPISTQLKGVSAEKGALYSHVDMSIRISQSLCQFIAAGRHLIQSVKGVAAEFGTAVISQGYL